MVAGGVTGAAAGRVYRTVTVDHTKVPSTQTNFAVLVNVTDATLKTIANGGHVVRSDGFDIGFYSDSGITTKLKWEVENYDGTAGTLVAWVKIASLSSSSDTVFYLSYGDVTITTDQSDKVNVWEASYLGVWHLGNGTTLSLLDSTSNANTLTNTASVGATTGQIDGAAGSFNGTSQALNTSANIDLTATNSKVTISMWCDWTAYASNDHLLAEYSTNFTSNGGLLIDPNDTGSGAFSVVLRSITGNFNGGHFTRPASGLKHFVFTFDCTLGTALATNAYMNGAAQSMTQDTFNDNSGSNYGNQKLYLMSRAATSLFGAGKLDEVRIRNIITTANQITAEYNNQNSPSTFYTLGSETPF